MTLLWCVQLTRGDTLDASASVDGRPLQRPAYRSVQQPAVLPLLQLMRTKTSTCALPCARQ